MKLTKENNDFGPRIFLTENGKDLGFVYGGNLDLYWTLHSSNVEKDNSFTSKKEIESAKSNNNGNVKQMTRSEIIAALKAERDKLCSKDNSLGKTKKITIK